MLTHVYPHRTYAADHGLSSHTNHVLSYDFAINFCHVLKLK
jgi:hypothetical protein